MRQCRFPRSKCVAWLSRCGPWLRIWKLGLDRRVGDSRAENRVVAQEFKLHRIGKLACQYFWSSCECSIRRQSQCNSPASRRYAANRKGGARKVRPPGRSKNWMDWKLQWIKASAGNCRLFHERPGQKDCVCVCPPKRIYFGSGALSRGLALFPLFVWKYVYLHFPDNTIISA